MAEVFRAHDVRLRRDVAVKLLRADLARDPQFHKRFRREAKNAAALNHPAVVAVHDTGEIDSLGTTLPYIVMELVEGVTLRDLVRAEGVVPPRRTMEIVADVCEALAFSHQHGIVHRDIKPANIMITTAGSVKVMDFGIARAITDTGNLTRTAAILGTAHYLSPEQAQGDDVDARSDIYSLGCVTYELLTGEPPFTGDSPVAVAYQHVRKDATPPSHDDDRIPPELDAVTLKALAKNRDNRYQSATEMREDLVRVLAGDGPDAPKVYSGADRTSLLTGETYTGTHRRGGATGATARRNRWLIAIAVLAVLAVSAAIAVRVLDGQDRVRVPQLRSQTQQEAIAALQGLGFRTTTSGVNDSELESGLVLGTDPPADSLAEVDSEVTIQVSNGPEQERVPDVRGMTPDAAETVLRAAGFDRVEQRTEASEPQDNGRVTRTEPAVDSLFAVTNSVVIVVGGGPGTAEIPDVATQPYDAAVKFLEATGFTTLVRVDADGLAPVGQVIGTNPPAGRVVPLEDPLQVRVSLANQFVMPPLAGLFWDDGTPSSALAQLTALGWTGNMFRSADTPGSTQRPGAVVTQSPAPGSPVLKDVAITLSFAP